MNYGLDVRLVLSANNFDFSSRLNNMDSNSQADEPPQDKVGYLQAIAGGAIALLTLVTPLYMIASYSSTAPLFNLTQQLQPLSQRR